MIDVASLSPTVQAIVLVGAVLLEAIVLYVGYGAISSALTEPLIDAIQNA